MVCTVRRYTGPLVLYSWTSSRSVCSPPVTAGNTTARTGSSGAPTHASAMANRMFSLPVTRLNAFTSSCTTLVRPGTDAVHRGDQQLDQGVGDLPFPGMQQRREQGQFHRIGMLTQVRSADSTAARARQPATTFGATPANRPAGSPTARTARSLRVSSQHRVQADVARHRLDQPEDGVADQVVVVHPVHRHQRVQTLHNVRRIACDDAPGQRLLGLMQRRPYDPIHRFAAGGSIRSPRHAHQQFLTDLVVAPLGLAHVHRQPPGQVVRVLHRALPETQVRTDLRTVVA